MLMKVFLTVLTFLGSLSLLAQSTKVVGYRFEKFDAGQNRFVTEYTHMFDYSKSTPVLSWVTNQGDTLRRDIINIDPAAKPHDVLEILFHDSPVVHHDFLRDRGDQFAAILSKEEMERKNGKWITTSRSRGRQRLPFGYRYSNAYTLKSNCPGGSFDLTLEGSMEGDLWVTRNHVNIIDCATGGVSGQQREVTKFNAAGLRTSFEWFEKRNGVFVSGQKFETTYDSENRETGRITETPAEKAKYSTTYDDLGVGYNSKFLWINNAWEQVTRTLTETTEGQGRTTIVNTSQSLKNGVWITTSRTVHVFDQEKRKVGQRLEFLRNDAWVTAEHRSMRYHRGELPLERVTVFDNNEGSKVEFVYDNLDRVTETTLSECEGLGCEQGKFNPSFKAFYNHYNTSGKVDHWKSLAFEDNTWKKNDSIANVYNEEGLIQEMFYANYENNSKFRFKFEYDIVTGVEHDEKRITVYPNPAVDKVFISHPEEPYSVLVRNIQGQLIAQGENIRELDISEHPAGIYPVTIISPAGTYTTKLLKR